MRKRLRKKLHLGEYQNWIFTVQWRYDPQVVGADVLWEHFGAAIEANNLFYGGGGHWGSERFVVGFNDWPDAAERERARSHLETWLREYAQTQPLQYEVGPLHVDLTRAQERAPKAAQRQREINRRQGVPEFDWHEEESSG